MKHITKFIVLLIFFSGCTKDKTAPIDEGVQGNEVIDFKSKTQILETSMSEALVRVDEERQIYTFKKSAFEQTPKVGEVILIPGELMRKVKSVSSSQSEFIIETQDALITEVIENGSFSFEITPEWEDVTSLMMGGEELLKEGSLNAISPITSTISAGGIDHTIEITPTRTQGKITSCSFVFILNKQGSTAFRVEGNLSLPTQKTEFEIKNGKLVKFNSNNTGIKGDFDVSMATAGGKTGAHSLKLPDMVMSIPIRFIPTPTGPIPNPIPMSLDIGIQFVTDMTIPDPGSSATGKTSFKFDGKAGFQYVGTDIKTTGSFSQNEITDGTFDSAGNWGMPIDLQFGIAFPRVAFNIAGQEVAFVHFGYTTGSRLQWNPLCKSGYSKMLIEGGYSLEIFGQSIISHTTPFVEYEKRAGDGCR